MDQLITKYRPARFEDVIGQGHILRSLREVIRKRAAKSFIFTGDTGVGKTTLARLTAAGVGCEPENVIEVDAASCNGIDDMRRVTSGMMMQSFGASGKRVYILDEAHALSKAAWQSLLKSIEEPPKHVYWIICTTELGKIPASIRTRCAAYSLKSVATDELENFLRSVVKKEKLTIKPAVIDEIAKQAGGSPRRALSMLTVCQTARNPKIARQLIRAADDSDQGEAIALCRALYRGARWPEITRILKTLEAVNAEAVRIVVSYYFTKVALGANDPRKAASALAVMEAFADPYPQGATLAHLTLSCGRLCLPSGD